MTQSIPSTDKIHVALVAATLALMETTLEYAELAIEQRQQIFVDTYETVAQCVTLSPDEARVRLEARSKS